MKLKKIGLIAIVLLAALIPVSCNSQQADTTQETVVTINPNALNEKESIVCKKLKIVCLNDKFDPTGYKVFEIADYDSAAETFVVKIQIKNNFGNTAIRYWVCDFNANSEYIKSQHTYYDYKTGVANDIDVGKINRALQDEWRRLGLIN
ncbi:MAG: hypothetical protein IJ598_08250 [Ruminococcus sp.]|nr:hypothetical protein [Ruminococcus sp.]